MIYTVTLNPSVDYFMKVNCSQLSDVNRITEYSFVAAGKGINCAKILDVMGMESVAVYFSGGVTGDFIDSEIKKFKYIHSEPIHIEGLTRVNVKVYGSVDNAFNPTGPFIDEYSKAKMLETFDKLQENDMVIISGSFPKGVDKRFVKEMCRKISAKKAKVVLDVSNFTLEDYAGLGIFLIKPNKDELKDILGVAEISDDEFHDCFEKLAEAGVQNMLLSLGKDGAYYEGSYGRYKMGTPKVKVVKSIGAGDSMLAAFVGTLIQTDDIELSLRMASATGTAIVSCESIPTMEYINEVAEKITVARV